MNAKSGTTGTSNEVGKVKSPVSPARRIPSTTNLLLFINAGGRCEFDGCNKYLLEHPVTLTTGNFAQMAHVVAFSPDGPRGDSAYTGDINDIENLMLLCPSCHKLIDDHPDDYRVSTLISYKQQHEKRIRHVTGLSPDLKTTVVQLRARIAGHLVDIPVPHVTEAVAPRYPKDLKGYVIDLNNIDSENPETVKAAADEITRKITSLYERGMDGEEIHHISLFALAPIPLLIHLGSRLSNKIPVEVYQRHRDTEDWVWKKEHGVAKYAMKILRHGKQKDRVALMLSLSGTIDIGTLPSEIDERYTIYEISLDSMTPTPTFLQSRDDLASFVDIYQRTLRTISQNHGKVEEIRVFPAIPAPVAVMCGRERLPKVDPALVVYDYNRKKGGFTKTLEVN